MHTQEGTAGRLHHTQGLVYEVRVLDQYQVHEARPCLTNTNKSNKEYLHISVQDKHKTLLHWLTELQKKNLQAQHKTVICPVQRELYFLEQSRLQTSSEIRIAVTRTAYKI